MSAEAGGRELLPIACALGPDDGAQRIGEWERLGRSFGLGREVGIEAVTIRFRDMPDVVRELDRLVTAERICCPFLSWEVTSGSGELRLVISGDAESIKALPVTL